MTRPLIITDCDEVLLHMVVPLRAWLDETHAVDFDMRERGFAEALRHKDSGLVLEREHVWQLLIAFFDTEMHRQSPIAGAVEALGRLAVGAEEAGPLVYWSGCIWTEVWLAIIVSVSLVILSSTVSSFFSVSVVGWAGLAVVVVAMRVGQCGAMWPIWPQVQHSTGPRPPRPPRPPPPLPRPRLPRP